MSAQSSLNLVPRPSFIGMSELDLYGCTTALRTAAHDPRIRGVLLELSSVELSTATVMEVNHASRQPLGTTRQDSVGINSTLRKFVKSVFLDVVGDKCGR